MKNKKWVPKGRKLAWAEIIAGSILLVVVSVSAVRSDLDTAEIRTYDTLSYIKEQCTNNLRLDIASESKSLMRIIESVELFNYQIGEESGEITDELLENYTTISYLTGIMFLDENGQVQKQYSSDNIQPDEILNSVDQDALLDVIDFKEKTYSVRVECEDGSYIDLAATGCQDRSGILLAYYHTPERYTKIFNHSVNAILDGYSLEHNGTIVISKDNQIVSSNDKKLIGKQTDTIEELRYINESGKEKQLVHADMGRGIVHSYGMMDKGRDYYIYAYMPENKVFATAYRNIVFAMIIYGLILGAGYIVRWRMSHKYQKRQLELQQQYTKELEEKNAELEEAVCQANRANMAKSNFLSRMSHDMRTPLNGIIGLLEIDEAHFGDRELIEQNHKKMLVSANHLLSLISDTLQMSKLESDEVKLAHEPMSLVDISREVGTIIEPRLKEADVTLEFGRQELPVEIVYGSQMHVRQIFLNIYGNCIKYNKKGGKIKTELESLGIENNIITYRWTVSDTGIGMSDEFLKHIYEPFVQEHSDARTIYQGTGLGMSIVKSIIDKMNGSIEISSEEGVGSKFVITLPFEIVDHTKNAEEKDYKKKSISGVRLLLVEDNELNAEIAETLLKDEGVVVTVVHNGQEAVDTFQNASKGTFDVILMDIMMPVIDGIEATKRIRSLEREDAKNIPIIAMTANAFQEDAQKCLQAGMNAHLSKPLQMDKVKETIARWCKK